MKYTCDDYRMERWLLALKKRLNQNDIPDSERSQIEQEVRELERQMGMD